MSFNPEKNAPIKLNIERIRQGLSERQMGKIKYECDLLRKEIQELVHLAPHLFSEGVTSANTSVIEEEEKKVEEKVSETSNFEPSYSSQYDYGGYPDSSDYDDMG